MTLANAKKYLKVFKDSKIKNLKVEHVSKGANIQEHMVLEDFVEFDPLIMLVSDVNFRKFTADLEDFIVKHTPVRKKPKKKNVKKVNYNSIKEFIYDKMLLTDGLLDRSYVFTSEDLKTLRYLCNKELKKEKKQND